VLVESDKIKVALRLSSSDDCAWMTHCHPRWSVEPIVTTHSLVDINNIKTRVGTTLLTTFLVEYLIKVGVSGMWAVIEHFSNSTEMLVTVDNDPKSGMMKRDPRS
jgi:hypothetical protein